MRVRFIFMSVLALLLVATGAALGQGQTGGQISGTVTDSSGAAIPGAKVVITNLQTGILYNSTTNDSGVYVRPSLPVGDYQIRVTAANFSEYKSEKFALHVADQLVVDVKLGLGRVEQRVEVTDTAVQVQTTQTVQGLVNQKQVIELPLNNRNFLQLTTLVPGVSGSLGDEAPIGLTSTASISINGSRRNSVNWSVDGASNVDNGSNITLLSTPTIDSIAEFKILTSTYSAEYGRSGGGVVNVVTKSGGRDFHGSGYEFVRNDYFNANQYFNKQTTPVTPVARLRYNNFGYTFGGPLTIPHVYNKNRNKTFFFWSQEWRRISRAASSLAPVVPRVEYRGGVTCIANAAEKCADFSNLTTGPTDPTTGLPFPNKQIPVSRFSPSSKVLVDANYWPLPNSGTTGYLFKAPNINNTRQEAVRVDHNFNDNWHLMGRYTHDLSFTYEPGGLFNGIVIPDRDSTNTNVPGQVFVAQLTTVITPTLTNDFQFNLSGNKIQSVLVGKGRRSDYPGFVAPEAYSGNPGDLMPGIAVSGFSGIGIIPEFHNVYWTGGFRDNVSKLVGKHLLKFGGEFVRDRKSEISQNQVNGSFSFDGSRTSATGVATSSLAWADFLLGLTSSSGGYTEYSTVIYNHYRYGREELYFQDDWKVRPNFTLNLGVRWMYTPPITDRDNLMANFDPAMYKPANAPTFANTAGTLIVNGTGDPLNGMYIAGKNSPFGKSVYGPDRNNFGPRLGFSWSPWSDDKTVVRGGYGVYYDQLLSGVFLWDAQYTAFSQSQIFVNGSFANPQGTAPVGTRALPSLNIATSPNIINPMIQQWNLGIQHELFPGAMLEVGYVGSGGNHLLRTSDMNIPDPAAVMAISPTGTSAQNKVRPYLGYTSFRWIETAATNRYHGLISNFRLENWHGLLLNLAYTWSRNITDSTNDRDTVDFAQNPRNWAAERAVARSDRTHIISASYVWQMPFFKSASNAIVRHTLGGWELSGITSIQSGLPQSRIISSTTNGGRRGARSDFSGTSLYDNVSPGFLFNPAAFKDPVDGTFGNSPRQPVRVPFENQTDLSISKNWSLWSEASRLQFRLDAFNALNHTQFNAIGQTVGTSTLGKFTGARRARELQLGLKMYF